MPHTSWGWLRGALTPEQGVTVLVLGLTVLAVGGIHPRVALLFGVGAAAALVVAAYRWSGRSHGGGAGEAKGGDDDRTASGSIAPYLSVAFAWLSFITLLQTIPLPVGLLQVISPATAAIWADSLRPFGLPGPSFATLSLAPEITRVETVKWAGYAALAWTGHRAARRSLTPIAGITLGLALLVAAVTLVHGLVGASRLYGVYQPFVAYPRWRLGPLLNANHLSGYLNLGIFAGLGLLFERRMRRPVTEALLLLSIGALAGAVVFLGSRGALGVLGVALALSIGAQVARARRDGDSATGRTALVLLGIVAVGVILPLVGYQESILGHLANKNFAKMQVAEDTAGMIADFPVLGVGRGAFEGVYFAYRSIGSWSVWTHPEDIIVQWVSEWGLLGTAGGVAFIWLAMRRARLKQLRTVSRFLGVGVLAIVVQNLADYSLELPAAMGLVAFVAGAVLGSSSSTHGIRVPAQTPYAFGGMILLLALFAARGNPELESTARRSAYRAARTDEPAAFQPYLSRFPADPYFPLYAGNAAGRVEPLRSMPFHNRVLERAPNWSTGHLVLADDLFRAGRSSQALLQVRIAIEREPEALRDGALAAMRYAATPEALLEAAPTGLAGLEFLDHIVKELPEGASRREVRAAILARDPCRPVLIEEIGRELTTAISSGGAPCPAEERAVCVQRVRDLAQSVGPCPEGGRAAELLLVELDWATGDKIGSVVRMGKLCATRTDSSTCLRTLATRAIATQQREVLTQTIRQVTSRECDSPDRCAAAWGWAAETYTLNGDDIAALGAATRATTEAPGDVRYHWLRVACGEKLGMLPKVVSSLESILSRNPGDARATALLQKARTKR